MPDGWWLFRNVEEGTCLDVTSTGGAFQAVCNYDNPYQQWDWVGTSADDFAQLRNKGSKRCLVTDHKNEVNAVWTRVCDSDNVNVPGSMLWSSIDWTGTHILIKCASSGALRTSPNYISIYTDDNFFSDHAEWRALPA